jgi:site-specific DNA-methyltransferase (adenine-specific)
MSNIVTRILNEVDHRPDILDCIANLSSDEVFTPPSMVNKVLDALPVEVWSDPGLKWLDPATKTGVFLRQIAYRLMIGLKDKFPDEDERRQHIFKNMIYGIGITELTALMARRSLYTSKDANGKESIVNFDSHYGNIDYDNRTHAYVNGNCKFCSNKETDVQLGGRGEDQERHAYKFIHLTAEEANKMKFDVIVGNPPYQLKDGGFGASAAPIYHLFIQQAKKLKPRYMSFIIPSRWFSAGKGLDKFRVEMLTDKRIKVIYDYPNANDCFPGVEIKGGVMYFIWDSEYSGDTEIHTIAGNEELPVSRRPLNEFDVFIRYNQAVPILEKVLARNEEKLDKSVSSSKPFGFRTFFKNFDQINNPDKVKIYASKKTGFVRNEMIQTNRAWIDLWKVFTAEANNIGTSAPDDNLNAIVGEPNSCCTETYLVVGAGYLRNKEQAENMRRYLQTRFVRFLISLRKVTHHGTSKVYSFVPNLPMDQPWDDKKLYERYDITPAEQKFIESVIKKMN